MDTETKTEAPTFTIPEAPTGPLPATRPEQVDAESGEVIEDVEVDAPSNGPDPYLQPNALPLTAQQQRILREPIPRDEIEIKPEKAGLIYAPAARIRQKMLDAFGPGGWKLVPVRPGLKNVTVQGNRVIYPARLYVHGPGGWRFVSEASGGQKYVAENPEMDWASAIEAARTDALTRTVKDLGVALDLWLKSYGRAWKEEYALEVWVEGVQGSRVAGKKETRWRRYDEEPFDWPWKETGIKRTCAKLQALAKKGPEATVPPAAVAPAPASSPEALNRLTARTRGAIFALARDKGYSEEDVKYEAELRETRISGMTEEEGQAFLEEIQDWPTAEDGPSGMGSPEFFLADIERYILARGKDPDQATLVRETIRWASKRARKDERGAKTEEYLSTAEEFAAATIGWRKAAHEKLLIELKRAEVAAGRPSSKRADPF